MEYLLILQIESHLLDGFGVDLGGGQSPCPPPRSTCGRRAFVFQIAILDEIGIMEASVRHVVSDTANNLHQAPIAIVPIDALELVQLL